MSETVIKIDDLSKRYIIGHEKAAPYTTLRDILTDSIKKLNPSNRKNLENHLKEEFWALKNINLEIKQGEKIGIIGKNGAGKSTLLKIMSRITEPTTGSVRIKGRVASLLEVGTGFHPELTGRENIFLNGAILGMRKDEIKRKFDEIVDFSGVEKFLDTPVKRYSSGMYVRLAFAVAAHLEPEILLIDEVLAVGDAEFQKKCLGKMDDVAKQGRTIVFVSHNMGAVRQLCERGVLFERGEIVKNDSIDHVVKSYIENGSNLAGGIDFEQRINSYSNKNYFKKIFLSDMNGNKLSSVMSGESLKINIVIDGIELSNNIGVGIQLFDMNRSLISGITTFMNEPKSHIKSNSYMISLVISKVIFTPGKYMIDISLAEKGVKRLDYIENAIQIEILEGDFYNQFTVNRSSFGFVYLDAFWEIQ